MKPLHSPLEAAAPIEVLFLVLPHTLLLDLAGPAEAFRLANQHLASRRRPPRFAQRFVGPQPQAASSVGAVLGAIEPLPERPAANAWVVVLGQPSAQLPTRRRMGSTWRGVADWLQTHFGPAALAAHPARRVLTVCSGSLLAAHAGLIGARACTTHHDLLDELRTLAPQAQVASNRAFVTDGTLASSAGITAGIDLALHMIAQACGDLVAAAVAQTMVVARRRGTRDPQHSAVFDYREHLHPVLHRVQDAICERPDADWTLASLARIAHVTPRHLSRLFAHHAGVSPLRYLQRIRLECAQQARCRGASATQAALEAGFSSPQQLRRARRTLADTGAVPGRDARDRYLQAPSPDAAQASSR